MELRQLRTLVAIAEHGTFAAAADAVGLTQSAVSLQIKALEDELGAPLFDRGRRPPQLNERGRALMRHARQVVEICNRITARAEEGGLAGMLVLGAVPTSFSGLLPKALSILRESHPRLHIQLSSGLSAELTVRVRAGELDAALVSEPMRLGEGLTAHAICREPLIVIAPPGTEGQSERELLESGPFIQFSRKAWVGRQIDQHLRDRGIRTVQSMEIDSLEAIVQMVAHGLGVSVVPRHLCGPNMPADFRCLPFGEPPQYRSLVIIERETSAQAPLVGALTEVLRDLSTGACAPAPLASPMESGDPAS